MEKIISRTKAYLERNERISPDEALQLFEIKDISVLASLARIVRERKHGRKTYFSEKPVIFISPISNIQGVIKLYSQFLNEENTGVAFSFSPEFNAPEHSLKAVLTIISELNNNFSSAQFSISTDFVYQKSEQNRLSVSELISKIKEVCHLVLYDDFSSVILTDEDRFVVWQSAYKQAVKPLVGVRYKIHEDPQDYINQLNSIRILQDEINSFSSIMPFAMNNPKATELHLATPTAAQTMRAVAIARIFIDNISHVAVPANVVKPELSFVTLSYGADTVLNFIDDNFTPTNYITSNGLNIISGQQDISNNINNIADAEQLIGNNFKYKNRIIESKWLAYPLNLLD